MVRKPRIANIMLSKSPFAFGTEKASYLYTNLFLNHGAEVLFIHHNQYDLDHIERNENFQSLRLKWGHVLNIIMARVKLSRWKPDIVFVHNYFSRVGLMVGKTAPLVGVAHNDKFNALKNYDCVIALRDDTAQNAIGSGIDPEKIKVIPNTCSFKGDIKQKSWGKPPIIGAMGNLVAHKNFATFIRALGVLDKKGVGFKAVIAGTGDEAENLKKLANEENLGDKVTFLGFVKDIKQFYAEIDLFCVPSQIEPFGLVVLESMVAQKPVVASNIASFQKILAENAGLLADPTSPEQFADHLETLLKNPEQAKKMALTAKKCYDECYSESIIYEQLQSILFSIRTS